MTTKFENMNQLKTKIEVGQKLYIENHIKPEYSRVTTVKNKLSYFFTVETKEGKESWIINGAETVKKIGLTFDPERECVHLYYKSNNAPFVSLYFNDTIIKGKQHYFTPSEHDKDFCGRCGSNIRNLNEHISNNSHVNPIFADILNTIKP